MPGQFMDILGAFTTEPPALDFIIPGFLSGTVGAMFSPGATGKSFFALELGCAIAGDVHGCDLLDIQPCGHGPVVYYAAEDPEIVLQHRLHAIGSLMPPEARQSVAEGLKIRPVAGRCFDIMSEHKFQEVEEECAGARLIVLDTLSRVHTQDENDNGQMAALLQALEALAFRTGAGVLFLHHVSKAAARDGQGDQQHASRGASVLTDNARFGAAIAKMSKEEAGRWSTDPVSLEPIGDRRGWFVRYSVPKQNYSKPIEDQWFQRGDGGVLTPVNLYPAKGGGGGKKATAAARRQHDGF